MSRGVVCITKFAEIQYPNDFDKLDIKTSGGEST